MEWFRFALLGLGTGALYALCAQGLVLVYRRFGVVNFAQSGFVLLGGYAYYELREIRGLSAPIAVTGAIVIGAARRLLVHVLIMRPMHASSPIARVERRSACSSSCSRGDPPLPTRPQAGHTDPADELS